MDDVDECLDGEWCGVRGDEARAEVLEVGELGGGGFEAGIVGPGFERVGAGAEVFGDVFDGEVGEEERDEFVEVGVGGSSGSVIRGS